MMKNILMLLFLAGHTLVAAPVARIHSLSGDVKIRRGMDEVWQTAAAGMVLENIDAILCLEGQAVLKLQDDKVFQLGSHAILDIGDLRTISRQELFLYLMSEKVKSIEPRAGKTELKVGSVSLVHGESKTIDAKAGAGPSEQDWTLEFNGAHALYQHALFSNAIIKLYKIVQKYPGLLDCGETYYYIGQSFAALSEKGQAADAFEECMARAKPCKADHRPWMAEAEDMVKKLRGEY